MSYWLLHLVVGFPLGLLYANAGEWLVHKYILHGLGKRKGSFWSFHWHEHHRAARRLDMIDPAYEQPLRGWNGQTKELAALVLGAIPYGIIWPYAPGFALGVWFSTLNYYRVHRKAHVDPDWGRRKLPWHVDHHMGADQDCNWCVTWPWFDHVMGTRRRFNEAP